MDLLKLCKEQQKMIKEQQSLLKEKDKIIEKSNAQFDKLSELAATQIAIAEKWRKKYYDLKALTEIEA